MSVPECNPACQKIILDGDLLAAVFKITGDRISKQKHRLAEGRVKQSFDDAATASFRFINTVRAALGQDIIADSAEHSLVDRCVTLTALIESTCEQIEGHGSFENSPIIVAELIEAENLAFQFMKDTLKAMGWNGPWPECLMS